MVGQQLLKQPINLNYVRSSAGPQGWKQIELFILVMKFSGAVEIKQNSTRSLPGCLIAAVIGNMHTELLQRIALPNYFAVACVQHFKRVIKTGGRL